MAQGDILATLQAGDAVFTIPVGKRGLIIFNLAVSISIRSAIAAVDSGSATASIVVNGKTFSIKVSGNTSSTETAQVSKALSHFGKSMAAEGKEVSLSTSTVAPTNGQTTASAFATIIEY